jgi:hypothetical protein
MNYPDLFSFLMICFYRSNGCKDIPALSRHPPEIEDMEGLLLLFGIGITPFL